MRVRKLILNISFVVLVIFLISGCSNSNGREKVIDSVMKAMKTNDSGLLLSTMPKEMQTYPFAEDAAKHFIKEYGETTDLVIQVLDIENDKVTNDVKELRNSGEIPYEITKSNESDKYVLLPNETTINLNVDPDAKLKINGKDVKIADFQKPFLPGSYELQATKEYPWTTMTDTKIVTTGNETKTDVTFELDGHRVDLSKELKGAEILYKGIKTGIKVGEPESANFGPIKQEDEKEIQLLGSFSWGETTSSKYEKTGVTLVSNFKFKPDEKTANELYVQFVTEYALASVKLDTESFTSTTEKFNLKQAERYAPSLFGHEKYNLIKTYYNKKTATLMYDANGNLYMNLEGVVQFQRLKTDYIREKEIVKDMSIKVLYDDGQKKWKVNELNEKSTVLPDMNEEEQYVVTPAKLTLP